MILQALTSYYETLAAKGMIARPGWSKVKVSWALEIGEDGQLLNVLPLKTPGADGKKMLPRQMKLPAQVKRTVNIDANFLCDNSSYFLGSDAKGKPEHTRKCFEAAKKLHLSLLDGVDDPAARAICAFFRNWDPEHVAEEPLLADCMDDLNAGANLVFMVDGIYAQDNPNLAAAWQRSYDGVADGETMRCLITGEEVVPVAVHPPVKGVRGAQSSGAALVSFNAPAFCSYNREQNLNAPVSKYAAFAYTTALNTLIADRSHVKLIGDMTVVYWAEDADTQSQDVFACMLEGGNDFISDDDLDSVMKALSRGETADLNGLPIKPDNRFYILGLAPNAARLAVRLFLRDTFGNTARHIQEHYKRIEIVSDGKNKFNNIPLWALLRETVNPKSSDKTPLPQMAGDALRAILTGGRYPATLLNQTMLRIRAEHEISRGRAAIIKAYLLRNTDEKKLKEVSTVALNEQSDYTPYVLGRLFSVLESTQQAANPGISATIKGRFFNSACATPAAVFPIIMKLSNSHLKKLDGGMRVYWSKQIGELANKLADTFPKNLSLHEQGAFILGYYHQTQKRYEKKEKLNLNQEEK
jgi:CRISPR-associated protein Csd1